MGGWFVVNDGVTTQTPASGSSFGPFQTSAPPSGAIGYVRTSGTLAPQSTLNWGCDIGFDLNATTTTKGTFDAHTYSGVSFWIKAGTSNVASTYYFAVPTTQTQSLTDGAYALVMRTLPTGGSWTNVQVHWSDLAPATWGTTTERAIAFDPSSIVTMQWELPTALTSEAYDVSIGGVQLLP
jgi:hypothetical protein